MMSCLLVVFLGEISFEEMTMSLASTIYATDKNGNQVVLQTLFDNTEESGGGNREAEKDPVEIHGDDVLLAGGLLKLQSPEDLPELPFDGLFAKIFMTYINTTLIPSLGEISFEEMTMSLASTIYATGRSPGTSV